MCLKHPRGDHKRKADRPNTLALKSRGSEGSETAEHKGRETQRANQGKGTDQNQNKEAGQALENNTKDAQKMGQKAEEACTRDQSNTSVHSEAYRRRGGDPRGPCSITALSSRRYGIIDRTRKGKQRYLHSAA